jgi:hypothetical protein
MLVLSAPVRTDRPCVLVDSVRVFVSIPANSILGRGEEKGMPIDRFLEGIATLGETHHWIVKPRMK